MVVIFGLSTSPLNSPNCQQPKVHNVSKLRLRLFHFMYLTWIIGHSISVAYADHVVRRELFVDRQCIESIDGADLRLLPPHDAGSVLKFDRPWEGAFCGYVTVILDGGVYRLFYRGLGAAGADGGEKETTCYAESSDGVHWKKPNLGLFEFDGESANNIVLKDAAPATHNFCPMRDTRPGVPPEERFKAVGGIASSGLFAFASADGVRWRRIQEAPVFKPEGWVLDSQNVPFWSETEGKYVLYFRKSVDGVRAIARVTSDDFLNWSEIEQMRYSDTQTTKPSNHLYTNQTRPYFRAPQIYLATAARFMPGRQVLTPEEATTIGVHPKYFGDTADCVLLTSRGGASYDRAFAEALIKPGIGAENWVSRTNYPALGVVPTGEHEMSLFVNQNYGQPSAHLRRYVWRLDGMACVWAPASGGELITTPLEFNGKEIKINFSTSAAGSVRVEVQDEAGEPIPGFALKDARELIGNDIDRTVQWGGESDVATLSGRKIRLRFVLSDAELYSYCFKN